MFLLLIFHSKFRIANVSNDKKNNAKKASEASAEIYIACLIGKLKGIEEYASIMEVKENYFEATVLSLNINVRVYVNAVSICKSIIFYWCCKNILKYLTHHWSTQLISASCCYNLSH